MITTAAERCAVTAVVLLVTHHLTPMPGSESGTIVQDGATECVVANEWDALVPDEMAIVPAKSEFDAICRKRFVVYAGDCKLPLVSCVREIIAPDPAPQVAFVSAELTKSERTPIPFVVSESVQAEPAV